MPTAPLTIEVDEDLKNSFESIADELGIGAAGAMTVMLRAFVRSKGIPFPVTLDKTPEELEEESFYSPANMAEIERRYNAAKRGEGLISFQSIEELEHYTKEHLKTATR